MIVLMIATNRRNDCVHKLHLWAPDQCEPISSSAGLTLHPQHSTKRSDRSDFDSCRNCDNVVMPICLHFIHTEYDVDKWNAVIICSGKNWWLQFLKLLTQLL